MKNFIALALTFALAAPVAAEIVTYEKAGISVDVPAGWKAKNGDTLTVTSADDQVSAVFVALPEKGADKATAMVEKALEGAVGKIAWEDKPDKEDVNGIGVEVWDGTAKEGKLQIEAIYGDTGDKEFAVYWFDTKESEAKYKKDTDTLYKSIKKVAAAAPASAAPAASASPAE
jgi:hypothetical protein